MYTTFRFQFKIPGSIYVPGCYLAFCHLDRFILKTIPRFLNSANKIKNTPKLHGSRLSRALQTHASFVHGVCNLRVVLVTAQHGWCCLRGTRSCSFCFHLDSCLSHTWFFPGCFNAFEHVQNRVETCLRPRAIIRPRACGRVSGHMAGWPVLGGGQTPTREVKNAKKNCRLARRHERWGDGILEIIPFQGRRT